MPPDELTPDKWRVAMDAKFFTYMNVMDYVLPRMVARRAGTIVNIIGTGGKIASPMHFPGGAANAALMLASAGLAAAWGHAGVRVNVINPGATMTDRVADVAGGGIEHDRKAAGRATAAKPATHSAAALRDPGRSGRRGALSRQRPSLLRDRCSLTMDGGLDAICRLTRPHSRRQHTGGNQMFSWYSELTKRERNTFWGCFAGWAVDAMDAQLFSFVLPVLIAAWGMTTAQAGYLATATLLSAAIGGWACGYLADRFGRVRIMQFTIFGSALSPSSLASRRTSNSSSFVRILQGLGFGGEWAAGAVLMGEIIRPSTAARRWAPSRAASASDGARPRSWPAWSWRTCRQEYGWRVLLMIGVLPGLLVLYLRRKIEEPESLSTDARACRRGPALVPGLGAIFSRQTLR